NQAGRGCPRLPSLGRHLAAAAHAAVLAAVAPRRATATSRGQAVSVDRRALRLWWRLSGADVVHRWRSAAGMAGATVPAPAVGSSGGPTELHRHAALVPGDLTS